MVVVDDDVVDDDEDEAAADTPRTRRKKRDDDDDDDDDELIADDDVEADLDKILKDRMVTVDEDDDEDDEDEEVDVRGDGAERLHAQAAGRAALPVLLPARSSRAHRTAPSATTTVPIFS